MQIHRLDGIHWLEMSENEELFSKIPSHLLTPILKTQDMDVDTYNKLTLDRQQTIKLHSTVLSTPLFCCGL
jgi:hypothetical protein